MNKLKLSIFFLVIVFLSCKKDEIYTTDDFLLTFSTDTVFFDTVFTTIGSATQSLIVYNKSNKPVKLKKIKLGKGKSSFFKINIDGISTYEFENYELDRNDSFYIFVQVKIDPTNSNNPILVLDSIEFHTEKNIYDVKLLAFGQDVIIFRKKIIENDTVLTSEKPFLIYNYLFVDTHATLTILPGTKLYFYKDAGLFVLGSLVAQGTLEKPIIFRHSRLEDWYNKVPGQWYGIHILPGSRNNYIDYCIVRNSIFGIRADSCVTSDYTLVLSNTLLNNISIAGLYFMQSKVKCWNTIIGDCGYFGIALIIGGYYEFYHCTILNNWSFNIRKTPTILINNYYKDVNNTYNIRPLELAYFANCILYGNLNNEILLDSFPSQNNFNYFFKNCLVKVSYDISNNSKWQNIIKNINPEIKNHLKEDYTLKENSICINNGDPNIGLLFPFDFNKKSRLADNKPDIGAFEF